jgi:hypothetical protein
MTDDRAIGRLANVCAMLASPNDGERANAVMMATRMLKELGLDWRAFTRRAFAGGEGQAERDGGSELDLYLSRNSRLDQRTNSEIAAASFFAGVGRKRTKRP